MATFTQRREPLVTCPYNPAHQVKSGRFQIHITKCRKAYPEKDMKQCPFSAEHVVPASQLMHHIYTCPLNTTVERFLTAGEKDVPSGNLLLPPFDPNRDIPCEENWDNEVSEATGGRNTLEDKIPVPAVQPVFADVQAMTPAERRSFYARLAAQASEREERQKEQQAKQQKQEENEVPRAPTLAVPRQPTTVPRVLPYEHAAKFVIQTPSKPVDDDDDSDESSEEEEQKSGETADMRARCMGLGRGFVSAPDPVGAARGKDREGGLPSELNTRMKLLGLGRGRRAPRN